jgi:hypothetical protein
MTRDKLHTGRRRYRKISTRMWGDEKFRKLSKAPPNGQTLWQYLISGPHTTAIPGIFTSGEAALAEGIGWKLAGFRKAWAEIETLGMAKADWLARVVWLPNALRHNEPKSPNVVNSWRPAFSEIPDCPLKREAEEAIVDHFEEMGREWVEAWEMGNDEGDSLALRTRRALRSNPKLRADIKLRDHDLCRYCGKSVSWTDRRGPLSATYDHVDPLGPSTLDNLVTACRSCNSRKRRRTPEQAQMVLLEPGSTQDGTQDGQDGTQVPTQVPSTNQDQDQDQDQEPGSRERDRARTDPGPRRPTGVLTGELPRDHLKHALCDDTYSRCVPEAVHHKLVTNLSPRYGGDRESAKAALLAWYPTVWARLPDVFVMPDAFKFWQQQFDQHFASRDEAPRRPSAGQVPNAAQTAEYLRNLLASGGRR